MRSIVTSCRAVLLPRFGGADVLEVRHNVRVPDLKPNEVVLSACICNFLVPDISATHVPFIFQMRAGYGRSLFESLLPLVLGRDVSGEIAAVGESVQTLKVGQEVFGALHPTAVRGTYADYAVLAEDQCMPKPSTISHVLEVCLDLQLFKKRYHVYVYDENGHRQRVLVVGGGGAVGYSAVQLAVAAGCAVAARATCENESIDRLLAAGAKQALDYTAEGESASLADRYGLAIGLPIATATLLKKQMQYRSSHGIEYRWTYMRTDAEGLDAIRRLTEAGRLKVDVQTQVHEAHAAKDRMLLSLVRSDGQGILNLPVWSENRVNC
ncbi:hypothetical protein L1987_70634 [Smallanthus sonchifolius]|uniref:Uncharacterized protein n=1 Tax=Smallanthus sonchifolius TaxID=185202 RepID=A0ACB9AQ88_9ASTR|nr:hypothetical protein L1987_70634 [Smallanthus sonchifolius]